MKSLSSISKKLNTTKKEIGFIPIYEKYLNEYKNKKINFLEIGFTKDSLKLYKTFLPKANIIGLDLAFRKKDIYDKADLFYGHQNDTEILNKILKKYKKLDIIIDDGSHVNSHIKQTFLYLFKHLRDNGLYFIEDLQTSYISRWGYGGDPINHNNKKTTMNFIRSLADRMHYQEFDNPFYKKKDLDGQIGFVHIFKNIAVIQKKKNFYKSNMSYKNSVYLGMIKKRKDFDFTNLRDIKNYLRYFLNFLFK
tara:strand:+ start:754 stop:1503 length:750 start_codon:yes stop_codon:yes gene_type:complete